MLFPDLITHIPFTKQCALAVIHACAVTQHWQGELPC